MVCSCSSFSPDNYKLIVIECLLCPCFESLAFKFWSFWLYILTPLPNGVMFSFNRDFKQFIVSFAHLYIWHWLTIGERFLSEEKKASSLFKISFAVTWERTFHNLGLISSAKKQAPLLGTRLNIIPRKKDKDLKCKEFMWANRYSYMWKRLYHFPWRLHWNIMEGDYTEETSDHKGWDFWG